MSSWEEDVKRLEESLAELNSALSPVERLLVRIVARVSRWLR